MMMRLGHKLEILTILDHITTHNLTSQSTIHAVITHVHTHTNVFTKPNTLHNYVNILQYGDSPQSEQLHPQTLLNLTLFPNNYQSNQCKLNEPVVADTVTLCYTHILSDE